MIYVTGDTHGEFERLGSKHFPGGPGDYLIVCGDFAGRLLTKPELTRNPFMHMHWVSMERARWFPGLR